METDEFWVLIDAAREGAGGDLEQQAELLTQALGRLAADDIVSFDAHFRATRAHGYTWDLWAVGSLAAGGMSDDAFLDFRAYLIGRGREIWERAVADPDSITDDLDRHLNGEAIGASEGLAYAAARAYEQSTGSEIPALGAPSDDTDDEPDEPAEPVGMPWSEDRPSDLAERFPHAWARWGTDDDG